MKNKVSEGNVLTLIATSAVVSGSPLVFGALFVVPVVSAKTGEEFSADRVGVFDLPKDDGAATQGAIAYWNGSAITATASEGTGESEVLYRKVGVFAASAVAGDTSVDVLLTGEIE